MTPRALHFVFKIGDRKGTIDFLKNVMGMKVLRHEEFTEGCKAYCNGPYDGKWSKTMIGYGPETNHFVLELTYNYGIGSYKLGNDFQCIDIYNREAYEKINAGAWPIESQTPDYLHIRLPDGYRFSVWNKDAKADPIQTVTLSTTNMTRSIHYWKDLCGMQLLSSDPNSTESVLAFTPDQCHLKLRSLTKTLDRAGAFGRIAFACPRSQLLDIQKRMEANKQNILKPLVSLDTPGKATVEVVILSDPDEHEICFVGQEGFDQLSQVDLEADSLLSDALSTDKSDVWFQKHGGKPSQ